MLDWDALTEKMRAVEAFNADWRHLRGALERDALWQQRHSLPEPSRSQLMQFQVPLAKWDEAIIVSEQGVEKFHAHLSSIKPLLDAGMEPTDGLVQAYHNLDSSADVMLPNGANSRAFLIEIIDMLRLAQGLPPLDGGLSPLN